MVTKGMDILRKEVIESGLCVSCGGCVGLCPHMMFFDGQIICMDTCDLTEGQCYNVCPQIPENMAYPFTDKPIGSVTGIYQSRATDPALRERAQYGGTISALTVLALKEGLINEAVLTADKEQGAPVGVVAKNEEEVLVCCGSRYAASASLEALNRRMKLGAVKAGIVALPCQARSLALAKQSPLRGEDVKKNVALVLGLFCTWSLAHRKLALFLKSKGLPDGFCRYDVPPPPAELFTVSVHGSNYKYPLSEVRSFVHAGCSLCTDMTAEESDISVGAVEGMSGWNTLIVRTDKGSELINLASGKGILELEEYSSESLNHLHEASRLKQIRGQENRRLRGEKI